MGTARQTQVWSSTQDRPCACGVRACALRSRRAHQQRQIVIEAQDALFDEPTRMADVRRPLLLAPSEQARLCA